MSLIPTPAPGEVLADLQLATRLQALAMRLVPRAERDILLRDILATGADILGATRSQLLAFDAEGRRLRPAVLLGMSEGFVAHFERRGWAAVCDAAAQRLAQALTNLLHNACKYAEPGAGAAELSVAHEPAQAVVRLRDHGIGIAAEQLPRIFDMYVQVDSPQRRSHAGLGIGLTLVRRFVQLHGGTIEASSEGPGRGSEFIVRLPLAACA